MTTVRRERRNRWREKSLHSWGGISTAWKKRHREPAAEADRGRHPGFPSFNVLAGGPGSLAERSAACSETYNYAQGDHDMSAEKLACPKCRGEMVRGFILDLSFPHRAVSHWVEGTPEKSLIAGTKVPAGKDMPTATFRCAGCGYLESYASPEFGAK